MLEFIGDMASAYGAEIKSICSKEFVNKVITKLKAGKKNYDSDILAQENVKFFIFNYFRF